MQYMLTFPARIFIRAVVVRKYMRVISEGH